MLSHGKLRNNDVIDEKQTLNPSTMKIRDINVANDSSVYRVIY